MRQVGILDSETLAQQFADYLLVNQLAGRMDSTDGEFEIWVFDENDVPAAREAFGRFQENPEAEEFTQARKQAVKLRQQKAAELDRQLKKQRQQQKARQPASGNDVPITKLLILFSVIVTVTVLWQDDAGALFSDLAMTAIQPAGEEHIRYSRGLREILGGQLWRLITPIFMHGNPLHLGMNMLITYQFGLLLEPFLKSWRFLLLVLTSAAFSNLVQYFWAGPMFGGMSGVDFALFGFLWIKGKYEPERGMRLQQQTIYFIFGWMILCFTGLVGPIANGAHVGGLIIGSLIALVRPGWKRLQRNL